MSRLLNPGYAAIKQVHPGRASGGGVTRRAGMPAACLPLAWIAGMGRANAELDAYAHHPYPVQPQTETPWSGGCKHCQTISMASLERLTAAVRSVLGRNASG